MELEENWRYSCFIQLPIWPSLPQTGACGNLVFRAQQEHAFCCALLDCMPGKGGSAGLDDKQTKLYIKRLCFVQQAAASRNHFHDCSWSFWENCQCCSAISMGHSSQHRCLGQALRQGQRWRAAISPLQDLQQGALNLPFKQDVIIYS